MGLQGGENRERKLNREGGGPTFRRVLHGEKVRDFTLSLQTALLRRRGGLLSGSRQTESEQSCPVSRSRRDSGEVFRGKGTAPDTSERRSAVGTHRERAGETETALLCGF